MQAWRHYAACAGVDTELFFPADMASSRNPQVREAKRICYGCEVRRDCLEESLGIGRELSGVWGGMSARERRAFLKRHGR